MKGSWWKFLGVILMIYTIIAGFLMPLKPGIVNVENPNIQSGKTAKLVVETYNAKLESLNPSDLRAWLVKDTTYILQAAQVNMLDAQMLEIVFNVPQNLPSKDEVMPMSLVVDAPGIGSTILPSGVFVAKGGDDIALGESEWTRSSYGKLNSYEGWAIPFRNLLHETLRNTYFHVSLWFSMFLLFLVSVIFSVKFLREKDPYFDNVASSFVEVGTLFGILGLITGAIWAKNTWGTYWTTDVKLNMAAISMMIYAAYLVLRTSITDEDKKATIASSYNIFAFFIIIPLIFVIPRLTDSLHPGNGGNPGFGGEDMDNTMRTVFYPAIIAFTLIGTWMSNLMIRFKKIRTHINEN